MISNISLANDRCESIYKKKTAFVSVENSSPDKIDFISNAFQQILNLFGKNNGCFERSNAKKENWFHYYCFGIVQSFGNDSYSWC